MRFPHSGIVKSYDAGNGLSIDNTVDQDHAVTLLSVKDGTWDKLYRAYARSDNLNLTGITDYVDVANGMSFGYSPANRLASSLGPWGDLSFTHDGVGNRTSRALTQGAGSTTTDIYGYPTLSNRIANALTNGIETRSFAHDAAGNMTQDLRGGVGGDLYEFTYNNAGRMATAKKNSSTQATLSGEGPVATGNSLAFASLQSIHRID